MILRSFGSSDDDCGSGNVDDDDDDNEDELITVRSDPFDCCTVFACKLMITNAQ